MTRSRTKVARTRCAKSDLDCLKAETISKAMQNMVREGCTTQTVFVVKNSFDLILKYDDRIIDSIDERNQRPRFTLSRHKGKERSISRKRKKRETFSNREANRVSKNRRSLLRFSRTARRDVIKIGLTTNYDLLGVIPTGTSREAAVAGEGVVTLVRPDELVEEVYVTDRQLQRVDLRQPLLVRQGGYVRPQALEGIVDVLHAPSLSHIGRLPLLYLHLSRTFSRCAAAPVAATSSANARRDW